MVQAVHREGVYSKVQLKGSSLSGDEVILNQNPNFDDSDTRQARNKMRSDTWLEILFLRSYFLAEHSTSCSMLVTSMMIGYQRLCLSLIPACLIAQPNRVQKPGARHSKR